MKYMDANHTVLDALPEGAVIAWWGTHPRAFLPVNGETGEPVPMGQFDASLILDAKPYGYRWATEEETERWTTLADRMVQVRVSPDDPDETDLAIIDNWGAL